MLTVSVHTSPSPFSFGRRNLWVGLGFAWLAWGAVNASRLRLEPGFDWPLALWYGLPDAAIWAALTPLVVLLCRRFPLRRERIAYKALIHVLAALGLAVGHTVLDASLYTAFEAATASGAASWEFYSSVFRKLIGHTFHTNVVIYWFITLAVHWLDLQRRFAGEPGHAPAGVEGVPPVRPLEPAGTRESPPRPQRLAVRHGRARVAILIADIDWVSAESNYARFHIGEASYLARASLKGLQERLDPGCFVRIHRSTIVNVERIERIAPCGRGDVQLTLRGGRQLKLSRRYRQQFERVVEALG